MHKPADLVALLSDHFILIKIHHHETCDHHEQERHHHPALFPFVWFHASSVDPPPMVINCTELQMSRKGNGERGTQPRPAAAGSASKRFTSPLRTSQASVSMKKLRER